MIIAKSNKSRALLTTSDLSHLKGEPNVIDYGAIIICRRGTAMITIDFKKWTLKENAVITLFPNDVVRLDDTSMDFEVEMLEYDKDLLREASLQLEQTVYSLLRSDRCRTDKIIVTDIINSMFNLLRSYFSQPDCICINQLVLLQLKAFFLGFYDWIYRTKEQQTRDVGSVRLNELFNMFMATIEHHYTESHDVAYYAEAIHISPKYLNTITQRIANLTPKGIISNYVILQIKLQLRNSDINIKQLAWKFNFSDTSFFCRYFKQHTGETPQQYRRNYKQR